MLLIAFGTRPEWIKIKPHEFSWLCKTPNDFGGIFDMLKNHKIDRSLLCPYGDGYASTKIKNILCQIIK